VLGEDEDEELWFLNLREVGFEFDVADDFEAMGLCFLIPSTVWSVAIRLPYLFWLV
jgi:hypothetical protein